MNEDVGAMDELALRNSRFRQKAVHTTKLEAEAAESRHASAGLVPAGKMRGRR